jgi:hypothetical protein
VIDSWREPRPDAHLVMVLRRAGQSEAMPNRTLGSLLLAIATTATMACTAGTNDDAGTLEGATRTKGDQDASQGGRTAGDASTDTDRATSELVVIDLGTVAVGQPVVFDVPAGAVGFTVIVEGEQGNPVAIDALKNPAGTPVLADATLVDSFVQTAFGKGAAAVPVPQNDAPASAPVPGTWHATFLAYDANFAVDTNASLHATVRVQVTDDAEFHGGLLDLHVYVPDGLQILDPSPLHSITAATAASDPDVASRIDDFYEAVKSMVGIDRGKVTFHAVPARFASVTSMEDLEDLFRESRVVADGQALHFMLSNHIEVVPDNSSWGIAAATGGAASRTGTPLSGVALSIGDFPAYGDALTMLHEAGHFVGLSHTSELSGEYFDPMSDTPQCVDISMTAVLQCPDRRNLMFPAFYGASEGGVGVNLSPGQVRTFRGSPVYRPYAH